MIRIVLIIGCMLCGLVMWGNTPGLAESPSENVLPVGNHPPALEFSHFPDAVHAVVWRNWGLVPSDHLAKVLQTSPENIRQLARAMGLPQSWDGAEDFRKRGYITLIRRNWHLLPYEQLLQLVDMSPAELAYVLREDDFLFVKLGNLKPQCAIVQYQEPNGEVRRKEAWMRSVLAKYFGEQLPAQEEKRFAFIEELSRPIDGFELKGESSRDNGLRFIYSYFASYGDPLLRSELDPYPDGLLQRLSSLGVNGVWLHVVLRNLAPGGPDFPEFGAGHETRLENLRQLVARAKKYGMGIYLYINEPRAMPETFFRNRPDMAGVREGEFRAMCTSDPRVRRWLHDSLKFVFQQVPDLAGVFTISASENLTSCASHGRRNECPRCAIRTDDEIIAEVNRVIEEGVHAGNPQAKVIVWDWGWHGHGDASSIIRLLPRAVWLMSVSEWSQPFERGGVKLQVGEYSISVPGPGPRAIRHWAVAHDCGLKTVAKVQFNITWELAAVPFLPVLDLVAEHCDRLNRHQIDGMMLTWTLGGYPSPNLAVASRFAADRTATVDAVLDAVAADRYGPRAVPITRRAWQQFSEAFREYPYDIRVLYYGPQQMGPANLIYAEPTGYSATMTGLPYDDLARWRGPYPEDVFADQWEKVASKWQEGLQTFKRVVDVADPDKKASAEADLRISEAAYLHFASVANQVQYTILREKLRSLPAGADDAQALRERMQMILRNEIALAKRLNELTLCDSRIGFEASNHYFYVPIDLLEKILNCEDILSRIGKN